MHYIVTYTTDMCS